MRKNVIEAVDAKAAGEDWLDLETLASVEVSSEDPERPIEAAFSLGSSPGSGPGWRAAKPGQQIIKLLFSEPQTIHKVRLKFSDTETSRTQEFTLRWSDGVGNSTKEIVRQQWNFSPQGATTQVANYEVNLPAVSVLELTLIPDISGGRTLATLDEWRVA